MSRRISDKKINIQILLKVCPEIGQPCVEKDAFASGVEGAFSSPIDFHVALDAKNDGGRSEVASQFGDCLYKFSAECLRGIGD